MNSFLWHPNMQKRFGSDYLKVKSAKGSYYELEDGRKVLDMVCSWWVTLHGHAHPVIAKAIYDQALCVEQVLFANFTHDPAIELSHMLKKILPSHFAKMFFSDNGSTAVEVALKIAYQYWKNIGVNDRTRFLCFEGAYHGDTIGAMSLSSPSVFTDFFRPLLFNVDIVPFPATFYGDEQQHEKETKSLEVLKSMLKCNKGHYAAIIIEPLIQGASGMNMCTVDFLQKLEEIVKSENILLIYDEVFVGFGRTGDWFASTKCNSEPDLICLSKGITGGFLPMAVTVATEEIYSAFYCDDPLKTFFHGHSYTANPLGCAAAIASLNILNNQSFRILEDMHFKYSKDLQKHSKVSKFRICGTVAAFDIITEEKKGYLNSAGMLLHKYCLEHGVFIRPLGNTIYLMPPYCIEDEELKLVYEVILSGLS